MGNIYDHLYRDSNYASQNHALEVIDYMKKLKTTRVLDVGCGRGEALRHMCLFSCESEGVDSSAEAVKIATANKLKVQQASILDLPFEPDRFELVTCFDVLEHLPEAYVPAALLELFRVSNCNIVVSVAWNSDVVLGTELHLCIKPEEWWLLQFVSVAATKRIKYKTHGNGAYYHLIKKEQS